MRIGGVLALDGLLCCPFPISSSEIVAPDFVHVDFGSQLGNIYRQSYKPPLLDQRDLVSARDQRKENADCVTGSQDMDEEEIIFVVDFVPSNSQYGRRYFLALTELADRVFDCPGIPVIEKSGLLFSEDNFHVVGSWMTEKPIEPLVRSDLVQNIQEGS